MRDFFQSVKFKILAVIFVLLIVFMFVTAYLGGQSSPVSQAIGLVTVPMQRLSSAISGAASGFFEKYMQSEQLYEENLALREENNRLREQLVDFEKFRHENEHYRAVLGLKEQNPEFELEPAEIIGCDPGDPFSSFTIDRGTIHHIAPHDPVITSAGLVGWVTEVGLNFAKVDTILDVSIDVGAVDARTRDIGVITGDIALAQEGMCKLGYLTRDSSVEPGDIIQTSGMESVFGVVFPKGLIIGTVVDVYAESNGMMLYASVKPAANISNIKDVFVLTSFPGQGEKLDSTGGETPS